MVVFNPDVVTRVQTRYLYADHIRHECVRVNDVSKVAISNGRVLIKDGKLTGISTAGRFHRRSSQ